MWYHRIRERSQNVSWSPRASLLPISWDQCNSSHGPLARYVKLRVAHAPEMSGTFSPPPRVSDSDMHHGTCVTHVPWCMPGSLTSVFLWSQCRGKRSRHSRRMRKPQFFVSGNRPMVYINKTRWYQEDWTGIHHIRTIVWFHWDHLWTCVVEFVLSVWTVLIGFLRYITHICLGTSQAAVGLQHGYTTNREVTLLQYYDKFSWI